MFSGDLVPAEQELLIANRQMRDGVPLAFDQKGDIKNPVYDIYVWKDGKSSARGMR